ncbi:hypothetical protein SUNI508_11839 [Seiridium unicorne]|uniref:Uncharacterized protein n=1 Tax=Seiridium unicorne TaxID=138068 RepID=A0ABR2UG64_9PEZI
MSRFSLYILLVAAAVFQVGANAYPGGSYQRREKRDPIAEPYQFPHASAADSINATISARGTNATVGVNGTVSARSSNATVGGNATISASAANGTGNSNSNEIIQTVTGLTDSVEGDATSIVGDILKRFFG